MLYNTIWKGISLPGTSLIKSMCGTCASTSPIKAKKIQKISRGNKTTVRKGWYIL